MLQGSIEEGEHWGCRGVKKPARESKRVFPGVEKHDKRPDRPLVEPSRVKKGMAEALAQLKKGQKVI